MLYQAELGLRGPIFRYSLALGSVVEAVRVVQAPLALKIRPAVSVALIRGLYVSLVRGLEAAQETESCRDSAGQRLSRLLLH
jgi:hypothetical protein